MLLLIDPTGVGSYSIVVCLKSLTKSKSVDSLDASSWFGVKRRPGLLDTTYSFEGVQLLDPDNGKISSAKFTEFIKSKSVFNFIITPEYPQMGDEIESGQAFLTDYSETFAYDSIGTFSASMALYNDVSISIAKFGEIAIGEGERQQIWMSDNLNTFTYNDGTEIEFANNISEWVAISDTKEPCCAYPNFDSNLYRPYGLIYNHYATTSMINDGIIPNGWHVPSLSEIDDLIGNAGGFYTGKNLKAVGTNFWDPPNEAYDKFNFRAVGAGEIIFNIPIYQKFKQVMGMWCSDINPLNADLASLAALGYDEDDLQVSGVEILRKNGYSIRCIKNI